MPRSREGKPERFPALAAELVAAQVHVIVAPGPALPALKQATSTIPIVMTGSGNPTGQGFVESLARPGGNITGLTLHRQAAHIAAVAATKRLPAMYGLRQYVDNGGLMAYGPDLDDNWRRSAVFVVIQ